jgi:hypothetical protein
MEVSAPRHPGSIDRLRTRWQNAAEAPDLPLPAARVRQIRRIFWLLVGVWVINLFDFCFTVLAIEQRILHEANPVAALLIPFGPLALGLYKFGLMGIGTAILWRYRRHPISETAVWVVAVFCVVLCLMWYRLYLEADPAWVQVNTANEILPARVSVLSHVNP